MTVQTWIVHAQPTTTPVPAQASPPWNVSTFFPFRGRLAFLTMTPRVPAFSVNAWPWNGGTISPARGGSTVLTAANFYWGALNRS